MRKWKTGPDRDRALGDLLVWLRREYADRTKAVENGTGRIDWIVAAYRVSFSEIWAKAEQLGIPDDSVELRRWLARQKIGNLTG
jgi:hypothetical protein